MDNSIPIYYTAGEKNPKYVHCGVDEKTIRYYSEKYLNNSFKCPIVFTDELLADIDQTE